jgi:hypothetical protein
MKARFSLLFAILFFVFNSSAVQSLERDFVYSVQGKTFSSHAICLKLLANYVNLPADVDFGAVPLLKHHQRGSDTCCGCNEARQIYAGYFIFRYKKGFPFLRNQIAYSKKYPNFQSYWPETSRRAEEINDTAVRLFTQLFETTALKTVTTTNKMGLLLIQSPSHFTSAIFCLFLSFLNVLDFPTILSYARI